jgi:hypothetical protein
VRKVYAACEKEADGNEIQAVEETSSSVAQLHLLLVVERRDSFVGELEHHH